MPLSQRLLGALNPQSPGVLRPCTGVRGPGQAEGHSGHVVLAHLGATAGTAGPPTRCQFSTATGRPASGPNLEASSL